MNYTMNMNNLPAPIEDVTTFAAIVSMALRQDIVTEHWRSINGYVNYQVSNMGRVRNVTTGKILKPVVNQQGYYYVNLCKDGTRYNHAIHRLVAHEFIEWYDTARKVMVDHIDRNKLNNYVTNLRYATAQQNCMNSTKQKNTSSKYKGVSFHKRCKKWVAHIQHTSRSKMHLGTFVNEQDAAIAYNTKASELFGEYANLNVID